MSADRVADDASDPVTALPEWQALQAHAQAQAPIQLRELFAADPERGTRLALEAAGLYVDY